MAPPLYADTNSGSDLANLSLQELADIPVTSVSKKPEPLADAAASVYVITNDDIRRSGARTLPEALRLAPNLDVAQVGADSWMISARGSDATSADKLLVLIDGRIVYSPLFSGTFWDAQNVMLEDIDRIEVISGPGGTLWGTNAVNGVINIITKKPQDTQGALASAGGGRYGADSDTHYGGQFADGGSYRVYGMVKDSYTTGSLQGLQIGIGLPAGKPPSDGLNLAQAGFRADWSGTDRDFTLQGDAYGGNEDPSVSGDRTRLSGVNLLSHWNGKLDGGSDVSLLAYYDRSNRYVPADYGDKLDIADVELQQTLPEIYSQNVIWGASYRYARDSAQNLPDSTIAVLPPQVNQTWSSLFAQDEAALSPTLRLITGARLEHNPYTGNEFLPNLRLAWNFTPDNLLWAAVSRAVRSPSRIDAHLNGPPPPPYLLAGNANFQSETARVYELGYRGDSGGDWSYSVTGYHYNYFHVRSENLVSLSPPQVTFGNDMTESVTGLETWGNYQATASWRLSAGFSTLREGHTLAGTALPGSIAMESSDAPSRWTLRSSYQFTDGEELDVSVRHVAALSNTAVPTYTTGDLRFAWSLGPHWDISVLAQNLFGPPHMEFGTPTTASEFGRGLYVKLQWEP
ncbi:MAG TPA: TonB-dependent receptor [Gammaproteobacteria bacterium]|nr:TonB-dependent receptor [Gammaproteobacteria bacterium]